MTEKKVSLPSGASSQNRVEYTENKFLGINGVKKLWSLALAKFVTKEEGKGLSSNDYTVEEKQKLASISEFKLPNASKSTLGGIRVGAGLAISNDGTLSVTGDGGVIDSIHWDNIINKPDFPDTASDIGAVDTSALGTPNGVATLNENGFINESQLPFISKIEEGIYRDGVFYNNFNGEEIDKSSNTLYIDINSNISYRWDGMEDKFIQITSADIAIITNAEIDEIIGGE
jgi:hypothetical protein